MWRQNCNLYLNVCFPRCTSRCIFGVTHPCTLSLIAPMRQRKLCMPQSRFDNCSIRPARLFLWSIQGDGRRTQTSRGRRRPVIVIEDADNLAMRQPITGYHTDDEGHWVAQLECGHNQHVRHDPPWMVRPWVVTREGRDKMLGFRLHCKKCEEEAPADERPS